jgi:hypothetical protein
LKLSSRRLKFEKFGPVAIGEEVGVAVAAVIELSISL